MWQVATMTWRAATCGAPPTLPSCVSCSRCRPTRTALAWTSTSSARIMARLPQEMPTSTTRSWPSSTPDPASPWSAPMGTTTTAPANFAVGGLRWHHRREPTGTQLDRVQRQQPVLQRSGNRLPRRTGLRDRSDASLARQPHPRPLDPGSRRREVRLGGTARRPAGVPQPKVDVGVVSPSPARCRQWPHSTPRSTAALRTMQRRI